jgi:MYXO-CTERM domain-containing protein
MEASIALQSIKSYIKLTLLVFGMMFLASESPASESPAVDFTENFEDEKFIQSLTANLSTEEEAVYLAWTKRHGSHDFAATGTGIQNDTDGTYAVALADVDRDGDLDLVAGSYTGSKLYLNKGGHRGFDVGIIIGNGGDNAYGVALGDMDGDGDVDLVVGNHGQKSKLYLNIGDDNIFDEGTAFGSGLVWVTIDNGDAAVTLLSELLALTAVPVVRTSGGCTVATGRAMDSSMILVMLVLLLLRFRRRGALNVSS